MMDSNYKEHLPNYNGPGTQPELPPFMNINIPHPANPSFPNQAVQHLHRPPNVLPQLPGLPQPPSFPVSMNFNVPPPTLASNASSLPWFYGSSPYLDGSHPQALFRPPVPQFPPQPLPNVSVPPPPLAATVFQPVREQLLTNRCPIPPPANFVVPPPACSISHFDIPPPQLPLPQAVASVPRHLTSAAFQCRSDKPVYQQEHGASNEFHTRLPVMGSTGLDSQNNNIPLSSADTGVLRPGQQEKVTQQLSTTASSFTTSAEQLERKRDADLIKAFVSESCQHVAKRKRTSAHSMTVSEFQSLLKEAILLNDQLKDYCYKIQSRLQSSECSQTVTDDDDEQVGYSHMQIRIKEIEECLMIEMDYMKQRMQKIATKRQYLKRRRQERYEFAQKKLLERAKLHEEMDKWHSERQSKELAVKMEAELKKSADATLAEVRRKITDVNQRLKLLSQMRKLRQLRRDKAKQRGISVTKSDDDMFNSRVDELTALLKQQLELYLAEQRALQVMLDVEQEETKEKEREKIKKTENARLEKFERELNDWLFGIDESTEQDHMMAPFRQYYDLANHSVDALIKIRAEWDAFVVPAGTPGATGVPYSWVTPSEPTDDVWASALKSSTA